MQSLTVVLRSVMRAYTFRIAFTDVAKRKILKTLRARMFMFVTRCRTSPHRVLRFCLRSATNKRPLKNKSMEETHETQQIHFVLVRRWLQVIDDTCTCIALCYQCFHRIVSHFWHQTSYNGARHTHIHSRSNPNITKTQKIK